VQKIHARKPLEIAIKRQHCFQYLPGSSIGSKSAPLPNCWTTTWVLAQP